MVCDSHKYILAQCFWILLVANSWFVQVQQCKKIKMHSISLNYIFHCTLHWWFCWLPINPWATVMNCRWIKNVALLHKYPHASFYFTLRITPPPSETVLILTSHTSFFSQFLAVSPSNSCRPVLFFNTSIRYCAAAAIFWRKLSSQMGMWSALPPRTILYWSFSLIKAEWARVEK